MMPVRPTPTPPGRFSLLGLLAGDQYETGLAQLAADRYGAPQSRGMALPTRQLCRDLGVGTASAGGNLVATQLEQVASAVRPALVFDALGSPRIEVASGSEISLPKFDGGVAGWLGEGDPAASMTATTVPSIAASARCAAARLALSRRMQNANRSDIERAVLGEVQAAVRAVTEDGFINGDGTANQPHGLLSAATGSKTFSGAVPTWSELVDMVGILGAADGDVSQSAWLVHPSTAAALMKVQIDADGGELAVQWIDGAHRIAGLPLAMSTACPEGKVILADWRSVVQIYFAAPQVLADRFSANKAISGALEIVVMTFCDVVLRNPEFVVVGSN